MIRIKKALIFFIFPLLIVILLIVNARIASRSYIVESNRIENKYNAKIESNVNNINLGASEEKTLNFIITNEGTIEWSSEGENSIGLSYRVLNKFNKEIMEGGRVKFGNVVKNGDQQNVQLTVKAPSEPGKYKVEVDLVQENVTWFEEKGSKPFFIEMSVT